MKYQAQIEDQTFEIELLDEQHIAIDGEILPFFLQQGSETELFSLILDGRSHQVWVENGEPRADGAQPAYRVHLRGYDYDVRVDDERSLRLKEFSKTEGSSKDAGRIVAPMPGLVVKLLVEPGQEVKKGEGLVIVEAMKMENEIRSPISGTVEKINVIERQAVEKGQVLAVIG